MKSANALIPDFAALNPGYIYYGYFANNPLSTKSR